MGTHPISVTPIRAFSDNYIWLVRGTGPACAVVDPGDHRPVLEALGGNGLELAHILVTHHHPDHVGGIRELLRRYPATVTGPRDQRIGPVDRVVSEGDRVDLAELGLAFRVIGVPGHTLSHVAYHGHGALFCGDTLFSIGCGRLFEGTPEQMQESLDKIAALPPDTRVYCAHEYTQSNCAFALEVEPRNPALRERAREVAEARARDEITLPSTLAAELAANPFLRTRDPAVVEAARKIDPDASPGSSTMAVIRAWKDSY
jgi:hydroxyacylglutathione hydrolase